MNDVAYIKEQLARFTDDHPEIACAYLFGSANDGTFTNQSDIDLGIAKNQPLTAIEKSRLTNEIETNLQRDVDLVDLQSATGYILRKALHGSCIVCRNTTVRYEIMRRLIYDQEDMQPLRNRIMQQRRMRFAYGH